MAKWNFFVSNTSLIKELDTSGNDVNPQSQSFLAPTLDLQGDKIVFKDNGSYKTAIMFPEIGEIDGVNPSDLQDAYDKIIAIIPNSGGGGGSTPDATTTVKGKLKLAGDLSGTADLPTVPGLANKQNTLTETNFGSFINGLTAKNTLVDADEVVSDDSADSNKAKKTSWLNVWTNFLKPKADALYATISNLALKQDFATATTGAVISFSVPQVYNSVASPSSSNITNDLTGARIGIVQKIFHNSGSAPTFPAGWVRLGTGSYVNSTLNIIYCEWVSGSRVEYWITQ